MADLTTCGPCGADAATAPRVDLSADGSASGLTREMALERARAEADDRLRALSACADEDCTLFFEGPFWDATRPHFEAEGKGFVATITRSASAYCVATAKAEGAKVRAGAPKPSLVARDLKSLVKAARASVKAEAERSAKGEPTPPDPHEDHCHLVWKEPLPGIFVPWCTGGCPNGGTCLPAFRLVDGPDGEPRLEVYCVCVKLNPFADLG